MVSTSHACVCSLVLSAAIGFVVMGADTAIPTPRRLLGRHSWIDDAYAGVALATEVDRSLVLPVALQGRRSGALEKHINRSSTT
jgi:hypothetical protein